MFDLPRRVASAVTRRLARHRHFIAGVLAGILILVAGAYLINRTVVADWLISPLLTTDSIESADAIVVLGAGVVGECGTNHSGTRRVLLAARLWREGRAPLLVFTGGRADGTCPIAVAMARLAMEVGVPERAILTETTSTNTRENAEHSAPLLRGRGVRRVLLVTDRLHMPRASGAFARAGFDIRRASVPIYEGHADNTSMLAAGGREYAALLYYRAKGWLAPVPAVQQAAGSSVPAADSTLKGTVGEVMQTVSNPAGPIVLLGASYAADWKVTEVARIPIVSKGVAGQQSFEMLERFDRDVVAVKPRAVILWGFINDVFRSPAADMEAALARVRDSYTKMIASARVHGIEPIVATEVTIRPRDSWSETVSYFVGGLLGREGHADRINRHVLDVDRWLVEVAKRDGLLVLDLQGALAEAGGRRRREFTAADGSHITAAGYVALTAYARPILEKHFAAR